MTRKLSVAVYAGNSLGAVLDDICVIFDYNYRLDTTFNGTGFFVFLKMLRDFNVTNYIAHGSSRSESWRTSVDSVSAFRGFEMLYDTLTGQEQHDPIGNWKPFTRLSQYGVVSTGGRIFTTWGAYAPVGSPWNAHDTDSLSLSYHVHSSGGVHFMDREDIWFNFQQLLDRYGSSFTYTRLYVDNTTITKVSGLEITDKSITLRMDVDSISGRTFRYGIDLTIFTHPIDENFVGFSLRGHNTVQRKSSGSSTWVTYNCNKPSTYAPIVKVTESPDPSYAQALVSNSRHSIRGAKPALYHTQAKAITASLGEISKNFETLMESPGTAQLIDDMLSGFSDLKLPQKLKKLTFLEKGKWIVRALLAAWITYIFAVKPVYETLTEDVKLVVSNLSVKFESTMRFSQSDKPFAGLPESLKSFLLQEVLTEADLLDYAVTFHSELRLYDIPDLIGSVFGRTAEEFAVKGLVPEPKYIWSALTLSFVVDWFIPISRLISDAQATLRGATMNFGTVGHSVFIKLSHKDGRTTCVYIRSNNSSDIIDPEPDSWLLAGGIYQAAAIPLVLLNSIFR